MTCIECKREIKPNEDYVDRWGTALHDACSFDYARRLEKRNALEALVKPLIDEVNGGSPADLADAIVDALTHSHRTLQQSFLGAVKLAIHKYSKLDQGNFTDLRNECAHQWTREVAKIENSDIRFPLI